MLVSLWSSTATSQDVRTRRTRTIQIDGRPIVESLRPDDEVVIIAPFGERTGDFDGVSPSELFAGVVRQGLSSSVTVDVTNVSGVLTSEGSWVATQFSGRIAEVVRRSPSNKDAAELEAGRPIAFTYPRGEVTIRGVVVRNADFVDYPYPARYFVMLNRKQVANGWSLSMSDPLRVNGDKVEPVPPARSLFAGLTLTEMRTIVKGLK